MIQNLNQMAFQRFGIILPERQQASDNPNPKTRFTLLADQMQIPIYRTVCDTLLYLSSGKSVLSVSGDGESFQHFYFDRPVSLKKDVYFSLSPFNGEATITASAPKAPVLSGDRPNASLRIDRQLRPPDAARGIKHACVRCFFAADQIGQEIGRDH